MIKTVPDQRGFPGTNATPVDREAVLKPFGNQIPVFGRGVERMDYTKGVLERLEDWKRFFEK
ncbi:MAG: hypothetical protein IPJ35_05505 [Elusimicrobia bacterium]|nr:hypothetical protein [Elusimicrobiota bacterium]